MDKIRDGAPATIVGNLQPRKYTLLLPDIWRDSDNKP